MLGAQSKALIILSKNLGWDPTIIPAGNGKPAESIANFNKAPNPWELGSQSVGRLPEGSQDSYPQAEEPKYSGSPGTDWQNVDAQGPNRASSGADPFAGMGGM